MQRTVRDVKTKATNHALREFVKLQNQLFFRVNRNNKNETPHKVGSNRLCCTTRYCL